MCKLDKSLQIYLPKLNLTSLKYSGNWFTQTENQKLNQVRSYLADDF